MNLIMDQILLFLVLTGIVLTGCEDKESDPDIPKSEWTVVSITQPGNPFAQTAEDEYTFEFINDTTYELHLDVNHCTGRYSIPAKGKIDFRGAACTMICCDSEYAEKMAAMFPDMTSYRIESGFLILTGKGQIKLR